MTGPSLVREDPTQKPQIHKLLSSLIIVLLTKYFLFCVQTSGITEDLSGALSFLNG
jgi:hypothetical protein